MTTLTVKEQVAILAKELCACTRWKKRGHAVCQTCFHRLSVPTRNALYARIPGFGDSYERALDELKLLDQYRSVRYVDPRRRARQEVGRYDQLLFLPESSSTVRYGVGGAAIPRATRYPCTPAN